MNREQKRMAQRQGTVGPDGTPASRRQERRPATPAAARKGFHPRQFLNEVVLELRKVARPSRPELVSYSTVVLLTIAFLMAFIFALDLAFSWGANRLFQ